MVFVACGLNHKTAPLNIREKVSLPLALQETVLNNLVKLAEINEAAILSTCNRTEIYCDAEDPSVIAEWLAKEHDLPPKSLIPYLYLHTDHHGIRHTIKVASGLDSMMLGEPQILGQMKQAYLQACNAGTVKSNLRSVFEYVFSASKKVRTISGIGNNPVSVAYTTAQLVGQIFPNYQDLNAFIIGSGETSTLVAKYLKNLGVKNFMLACRTPENAQHFVTNFSAKILPINDISQHLAKADIVISATTCPLPFINKNMVETALSQRDFKPMCFIDLAVPRDIEDNVSEIPNVHLYNIDDLEKVIAEGMNERRRSAEKAEILIDNEVENYIRWHRSLKAKNIICDYRKQMKIIAEKELNIAKLKLTNGKCQYNVLEEFSERLINKLSHDPTIGLRHIASNNREDLLDLAQYILEQSNNEEIT